MLPLKKAERKAAAQRRRMVLNAQHFKLKTFWSVSALKKVKREAAAQRRPAQSERKNRVFPRNDRPYGLKRAAFQTENVLKDRSGKSHPCRFQPAGMGLFCCKSILSERNAREGRATSVSTLKKVKRKTAAQRRPARRVRKNRVFSRNDRPYGLKRAAFQTENSHGAARDIEKIGAKVLFL